MRPPRVLVSGSLAFDRIMDFPGRFRDAILPTKIHLLNVSFLLNDLREHYGGTAGNIAYSLRLFGLPVAIIGSAGADFLPYYTWLVRREVDLRGVQRVPGRTAVASILTDRDDNQISAFYPGAMGRSVSRSVIRRAFTARPSLVVLAPSDIATSERVAVEARRHRLPVVFDPGQQIPAFPRKSFSSILRQAAIFISNDYELALALRKLGWSLARFHKTVPIVVTTLGPRGAIVAAGSRRWSIPAARPKSEIDPTGAGDAFRAGFLAGFLKNYPLPRAAQLGAVTALYTVERVGTQTHHFTKRSLAKRFQENYHHGITL